MNDSHVSELLEQLTPRYEDRTCDWNRVAADAEERRTRPRLRSWSARVIAVAGATALLAGLVLAWPFQADQPGLFERARAAIGDGPVLHVVLRGEWGGTLVDLQTGERSPVHGENEVWYDSERGRVHTISRLGGVVQHEELYEPKQPPADLAALGRQYKQALEAGTARVAGEGTIDGESVVWVTIHSELLPDVADGKDHEWAQQVAVSKRTFKPVALRETRDAEPGPGTTRRVLNLELLAAGHGNFTAAKDRSLDGTLFSEGREPIALEHVRAVLGRTPLWLSRKYENLPLAQAFKYTTARGEQREVRITGPAAQAAIKCNEKRGRGAGACIRALGLGSISIRPDGVFRSEGPVVWTDQQTAIVLFYGTVGDNPATHAEDVIPLYDRPHLTVTQTTEASLLRRGVGSYVPPDGSVFIGAGARVGALRMGGVHVMIEAANEEAILAAARALQSMTE
jgi:hypothetical protein